jgi:hypothetical protein
MKRTEPSLEDWKELYCVADAFRKIGPWEWMYDSDIIGVKDPQNGTTGYCCIMGGIGEFFGMAVYLGTEGLRGYEKMLSGRVKTGDPDSMFIQDCLMVSFESSKYVEKEDKIILSALGLKYRGPNAWPLFRRYEPGYHPWFITGDEAVFLTTALKQAAEVALRFRDDELLLTAPKGQKKRYFVRVPERSDNGEVWKDEWQKPDLVKERELSAAAVDELRIRKIKINARPVDMIWEVDFFYSPAPVAETGGRPYFPEAIMIADSDSGFIFGIELANPDECGRVFAARLLTAIEEAAMIPSAILAKNEAVMKLFGPLALHLGIDVRLVKKLPVIENARRGMIRHFMGT